MKRGDDALKEYRKAVELTPGDSAARVGLAESLHAENELDLALRELEQAVKDNPSYVSARVLLAEYLLEDGDVEGALSQLAAAKAVPGTPPGVLATAAVVTGNTCDKKEDYSAAITAYREAITLDGTRGDAWFYLAGDLERTGNAAEAKTAYQKALELCRGRAEWEKFYEQAAEKSRRL
jgi:cytochrome c-type biogenesis protein CcmH/NrfG